MEGRFDPLSHQLLSGTKWRILGGQSIKSAGHYISVHLQLAGCRALAVCSACVAGSSVHITG
jgi:hypothetical protein